MNITISFDVDGYKENEELEAWLNEAMTGKPVKVKRTRKPMTEEEKAAFRARMVKGQEEAAKAREEEDAKGSEATPAQDTVKPVGRAKAAAKKS